MRQFFRSLWGPILLVLLFAAPLALAVSVSAEPPETIWLDAPGWSRARLVASTALDEPVPLVADGAGGVYLLVAQAVQGAHQPAVLALDAAAQTRWEHRFDRAPARIGSPQLVRSGADLAALWLSQSQLFVARLGSDGALLAEPTVVSGDARVASYAVTSGAGRSTVWYASVAPSPGLFQLSLDAGGAPVRVAEQGARPALQLDEAGTLHAVWLVPQGGGLALMYATFPGGSAAGPADGVAIASIGQADLDTLDGPWLGISGGAATVLWTESVASGMSAGQRLSRSVSFPLGSPEAAQPPALLSVPRTAELTYGPAPDGLDSGPRAPLDAAERSFGLPPTGLAIGASGAELALTGEVQLPYRASGLVTQVAAIYMRDGQPSGYQLLTRGPRSSLAPSMAAAPDGALFAAWHEVRRADTAVYLAGTAPATVDALGRISGVDVARMANDTIFGMVAGVLFSPLTILLWLVPALLALLVTWPLRRSQRLAAWAVPLSVALAVGVYWAAKITLLRDALTIVPFAAWVPVIPGWLGAPLQIGVPALIAVVAAAIAWRLAGRRSGRSAALLVLAYGAIDAVLTMAVYGAALYG